MRPIRLVIFSIFALAAILLTFAAITPAAKAQTCTTNPLDLLCDQSGTGPDEYNVMLGIENDGTKVCQVINVGGGNNGGGGGSGPGDTVGGGICAEFSGCDSPGSLVVAPADEPNPLAWSNNFVAVGPGAGPTSNSLTDGFANTSSLMGPDGIDDTGDAGDWDANPALNACWTKVTGGHNDWFLPAKTELNQIYSVLVDQDGDNDATTPSPSAIGHPANDFNFLTSGRYSSSTLDGANGEWTQLFSNGSQRSNSNKIGTDYVRCARRTN